MSIPTGWNESCFRDVATIANGQVDPRKKPYCEYFHIGPENIESGTGKAKKLQKTKDLHLVSGKYLFDEKAIVYSKIRPNLNKVCLPNFVGICSADMYPVWAKDNIIDRNYLFQFMTSEFFLKFATAASSRTGLPKINRQELDAIKILYPPLREQRRIAEILGVWDESIDLLEKLIAAKRKLKQGIMQQLLTSKKRFKEFEKSNWRKVLIEDVADINPRKHPGNLEFIGEFVEMASVSESGHLEKIAQIDTEFLTSGYTAFINEDTLIAKITPCFENGKGAFVQGLQGIGSGSTEFYVLRAKSEIIPVYLYYLTRTYDFGVRGKAMMQGSGGQQRVPSDFIKQFAFKLPSLPEQEKIAAVLSVADAEISILEKQLAAYKEQKRGLMQQLLTGRTRILGLEDEEDKEQK